MIYEMYQQLSHNRKRLISLFDDSTDQVTMVLGGQPVVMQDHTLRTSVQPSKTPPKPKATPTICPRCQSTVCHCPAPQPPPLAARPHRIRTQAEAKQAVIAALMEGVPPPPSLDDVVQRQRQLGLR